MLNTQFREYETKLQNLALSHKLSLAETKARVQNVQQQRLVDQLKLRDEVIEKARQLIQTQ